MASATIEKQILAAMIATLKAELPGKIEAFPRTTRFFDHMRYIQADECPAVTLDASEGVDLVDQTLRGRGSDGTVYAGMERLRRTIDVGIWLKGPSVEVVEEELARWATGVRAVMSDNDGLGTDWVFVEAERAVKTTQFAQLNPVLGCAVQQVRVDSFVAAGEVVGG